MNKFKIIAFYEFIEIKNLLEIKENLRKFATLNRIKGTILISREGINENNRKVANLAKDGSKPVCVSLISPFKENREDARKVIGDDKFIEVYIECSPSVCEERDVKGMYKKARQNEIKDFIGVHTNYEIPDKPDLTVNTEINSLDQCVQEIFEFLPRL